MLETLMEFSQNMVNVCHPTGIAPCHRDKTPNAYMAG